MRDLSREFAEKIYYMKYWKSQNLDAVARLAPDVAKEVFEMGVNMGSSRGSKALQQGLNLLNRRGRLYPDIAVDGRIGNSTLKALAKLPKVDHPILVKIINAIQGKYYIEFATNRESQEVFIRGWFKRVQF
jgi:lysozyme family protein